MNEKNLHKLIERYEENFAFINNSEHDEIFKWSAAKTFNEVWKQGKLEGELFSDFFKRAVKNFLILTDNGMVSPTNGVIKIAEQKQDEVENLFRNVLFADDNGDLNSRQNNVESFIEGMNKLKGETHPQSFKYKQDRHPAFCYLAFYKPSENYIYRYSDAEEFAKRIEYGFDIGSGSNFSLANYYRMCDLVVEALKEHPSLLQKHFELVDSRDEYYRDESLHILVFDLMYCCRCYNFYGDMTYVSRKETLKEYSLQRIREKEKAEKQEKIRVLEEEIFAIDNQLAEFDGVSLLDIEVESRRYGKGKVISHNANIIEVKFEDVTKKFVLNNSVYDKPSFENDKEIIEAYTRYSKLIQNKKSLQKQIKMI